MQCAISKPLFLNSYLALAALMLGLAGCGGGQTEAAPVAPQASPLRARLAQAPLSYTIDQPGLLAWAEAAYPEYFSGGSQDGVYDVYSYRHYPATGNFLAVADGRVFVYGPVSGGAIRFVGRLLDFACQIQPQACDTTAPLSALQSSYEESRLGLQSNGFITLSSRTPWRTTYADLEYFITLAGMAESPRSQPDGNAYLVYSPPVSLVTTSTGGGIPARYASCSGAQATPDTYYPFYTVVLTDLGTIAKSCGSGPIRIQYVGADIYVHSLDVDGRTYNTSRIADLVSEDIPAGQKVTDFLYQEYSATVFTHMQPNAAVMPPGAKKRTLWGHRVVASVTIRSADGKYREPADLVPVPVSGQSVGGTPAATLEQAFPWREGTLTQDDGEIRNINGRRGWIKTATLGAEPTANRLMLVEVDGKVYEGYYNPPYSTPVSFGATLNDVAWRALNGAGLKWASDIGPIY